MSNHQHNPSDQSELSGKKLLISTVLNITISLAEVIGGLLSNSLALLSDALHNFSDGVALLIAYVAHRISKRPSNEKKTFGYRRIQILVAFFNTIVLIVISIYLLYEAYLRFFDPQPIKGLIMFIVATIGLLANLTAVFLLQKDAKKSLNIKAAYLHLIGDTLSSVAVIIGGVLIYFFEIFWIDPVITVLISIYIIKESWQILKETIDILMQATPKDLSLQLIREDIEMIDGINNIHHLHAWSLDDRSIHFECHIDLTTDLRIKETENIQKKIEKLLHDKYNIRHVTVQFEHNVCADKEMIVK